MQINFTFSIEDWQPIFLKNPLPSPFTSTYIQTIFGLSCRNSRFFSSILFSICKDEMNEMSIFRYYHSVWLGFAQHSSAIFHFRLRKAWILRSVFLLRLLLSFAILLIPDANEYFIIFLASCIFFCAFCLLLLFDLWSLKWTDNIPYLA